MGMDSYCTPCLAALALSCASGLFAERAEADFYLGTGLGYGDLDSPLSATRIVNTAPPSLSDMAFSQDDKDLSWKLYAGYQWTEIVGIELAYLDLGKIDANLTYESSTIAQGPFAPVMSVRVAQDFSIDTTGVALAAVLNYPTEHPVKPYARVGVFSWREEFETTLSFASTLPPGPTPGNRLSTDNQGESLMLGLGVEYRLASGFAARAEYEFIDDVSGRDIGVLGLSLQVEIR